MRLSEKGREMEKRKEELGRLNIVPSINIYSLLVLSNGLSVCMAHLSSTMLNEPHVRPIEGASFLLRY